MENHLLGLKQAVYDTALLNPAPVTEIEGYELLEAVPVQYEITVQGEDIWNLFTMTPYYYKTGKADQEKLKALDTLTTQVEILVLTYTKA
jgi:23S rRNA (guanine745-N1)-methyltransferase